MASPAAADVVEGPPDTCPRGSTPSSSHSGPVCVPFTACTDDSSCAAGERCTPIEQCVEARPCGGDRPPGPCEVPNVVGECGGGCPPGSECRPTRICVAAAERETAPPTVPAEEPAPASSTAPASSGGCSASPHRTGGLALLALLAVLVLARRRALPAALGLGLALLPAVAAADAISPPPAECPHGGEPWGSHSGPICSPRPACDGDAACPAGQRCAPVAYCVEEHACGGDRPADDVCIVRNVVGRCSASGECPGGSVCFRTQACEDAPSGGCSARPGAASAGLLVPAIVCSWLARRRGR